MQWVELRPTFEIALADERQSAIDKLHVTCEKLAEPTRFLMHGEYGELHIRPEEHRVWSPHLSFYVSMQHDRPVIHGRFAPRMEVWTCVWVVYLFMAFSAFYGFTLAYSQWMLKHYPWGLWVALSALLFIVILYVVAHVGQQLSADQMRYLRERLDNILHQADVKTLDTAETELVEP
ncbi:MAG: hypothetical protein KDB03_24740 [Planctomycetales bacterium]|nr:hypothetical protein [Planctomycetales bacterium]